MVTHGSAPVRETPHETETTQITISDSLRRRARSLIRDKSIDPNWRSCILYALEIRDPLLPDLVRRADSGEKFTDTTSLSETSETDEDDCSEDKIVALAKIICQAGNEPAAALLVLMGTLEDSTHPKLLANTAKHVAFTCCGESNLYGMVDLEIELVESRLLSTRL